MGRRARRRPAAPRCRRSSSSRARRRRLVRARPRPPRCARTPMPRLPPSCCPPLGSIDPPARVVRRRRSDRPRRTGLGVGLLGAAQTAPGDGDRRRGDGVVPRSPRQPTSPRDRSTASIPSSGSSRSTSSRDAERRRLVTGRAGRGSDAVAAGQLAIGARAVGASRAMLQLAREHALERIQFGRPIGPFQAVRHRLADSLRRDRGRRRRARGALGRRLAARAALAKAVAGQSARTVARHCQQVLAGIGFTTEHHAPPLRSPDPGPRRAARRRPHADPPSSAPT